MTTRSRLDVSVLPGLCSLGPPELLMTGIFRVWMIYHFSDPARIVYERLRDKVWQRDPAATGIVIEAHDVEDLNLTETRPAIIIKRQAWKRIKIGIADRRMGELTEDGSEHCACLWQGAHTLFCIGSTGGEANLLAGEVRQELNQFAQPVRHRAGLNRLEVAEVGETARLDQEGGKNRVVPVNVAYVLEESWILRQEAPFLKRLDMSLLGL